MRCSTRFARQLGEFGIRFDSYFSEQAMRERSEVDRSMTALRERGLLYTQDGAQWYRSTQFGDDKDRTVIKSDGELTYFAADIAYHRNKFERKFDKLINVWGADHHGYVPRLKAAMQGLGYDANALAGGAGADGSAYPRRRAGAHGQTHRRIRRSGRRARRGRARRGAVFLSHAQVGQPSRLRFGLGEKAVERQSGVLRPVRPRPGGEHFRASGEKRRCSRRPESVPVERLELAEESELIRQMIQFNDVLEESVRELEPHRVVFYLLDFAGEFHRYYNRNRVVSDDVDLSRARLLLLANIQKTIRRGLEILGVDAPMKMAARAETEA